VDRDRQDLQRMLMSLPKADLKDQPWPGRGAGAEESRFELTRALLRVLEALGYTGLMVLVDRIDEPALITGKTERMRPVVWPLFDNKFLQQEGLGLKLLLPLELRHELFRESADFFQEARLDKQSLVDRLSWSGAVLYDLCGSRLSACRAPEAGPMRLTDLFTEEVTAELLVDALDQMQQPRDAFKFLYSVLQEHCRLVPEDQASFQIPRLVVEQVRRQQAQRVQELQRGLTPA